jgi:outer membrane protein insertion porin family
LIDFIGNEKLSDKTLRKAMKDTKQKKLSYTESIEIHKGKIQNRFRESDCLLQRKGYRDARILSDTITYLKDENALSIKINVEEGNKYYFGDIKFLGNTVYSNQLLSRIIGVKKGETYNGVPSEKNR